MANCRLDKDKTPGKGKTTIETQTTIEMTYKLGIFGKKSNSREKISNPIYESKKDSIRTHIMTVYGDDSESDDSSYSSEFASPKGQYKKF